MQLRLLVLPAEVGKSFKCADAQTQLRLYSEQQRAFEISNICYSLTDIPFKSLVFFLKLKNKNLQSSRLYLKTMEAAIFSTFVIPFLKQNH